MIISSFYVKYVIHKKMDGIKMTTKEIIAKHSNLKKITAADKHLFPDLVKILCTACEGNPLLEFILGNSRRRKIIEYNYFYYMLKSGLKYGHVFCIVDDNNKPYAIGMMVSKSNRLYSLPHQVAAGALRIVFRCGLSVVKRSFQYEHSVGKIRRSKMPTNHLYGYFLAIDPKKQRDAFRSSKFLLEGCKKWAKERGLVFYFETMSKRHQIYYSKHGFNTKGEFSFEKAGITFYAMETKD